VVQFAYFNQPTVSWWLDVRRVVPLRWTQAILVRLADYPLWQSSNEGYSWVQHYPQETPLALYHHKYTPDSTCITTSGGGFFYTTNAGRSWHATKAPTILNTFGKLYSTSIQNRTTSSGPEKMAVPDAARIVVLRRTTRETTVGCGPYWTHISGISFVPEMRHLTRIPPRSFVSRTGTTLATRRFPAGQSSRTDRGDRGRRGCSTLLSDSPSSLSS